MVPLQPVEVAGDTGGLPVDSVVVEVRNLDARLCGVLLLDRAGRVRVVDERTRGGVTDVVLDEVVLTGTRPVLDVRPDNENRVVLVARPAGLVCAHARFPPAFALRNLIRHATGGTA